MPNSLIGHQFRLIGLRAISVLGLLEDVGGARDVGIVTLAGVSQRR